jgi:hypothetical protein
MTTNRSLAAPLPADVIQAVLDRYDCGLALQAHEAGRGYGPLQLWQPVEAQILAGRLANQLGAPRLARWLHRCAYRAAPSMAEADTRTTAKCRALW